MHVESFGQKVCVFMSDFYDTAAVAAAVAAGNLTMPTGVPYPPGTGLLDIYPSSTGVFENLEPFRVSNSTEQARRANLSL